MTSEMVFRTFPLSSLVPHKKVFTRTEAIDSWYFSETSSRAALTSLHFLSTSSFLFVDPQSGQVLVSSIELHEELHDLDGVEEQHGDDKSEKDESFKLVPMSDSNSAIRAWRSFICISRDSIFAVLSASLELSSSKLWWIFPPKEMSFARSGSKSSSKSSATEFSRPTIGRKRGELIRLCGGIPFWRKRPAIKPNVEATTDDGTWHSIKLNNNKRWFGGYKFPGCYTSYFVGKSLKYFVSRKISRSDTTNLLLEDIPMLSRVKWLTCNPRKTRNVEIWRQRSRRVGRLHAFTSNTLEIENMMLFNFESPAKVKYFLISTKLTRAFTRSLQIRINKKEQKMYISSDVNNG